MDPLCWHAQRQVNLLGISMEQVLSRALVCHRREYIIDRIHILDQVQVQALDL